MDNILKYDKPAKIWEEALPIGNGRLGGMVFGGILDDRIALNEDTLWSGNHSAAQNNKAKSALPLVRKHIVNNELEEAQKLIATDILCDWGNAYMPLGNLIIKRDLSDVSNYVRTLDIKSAICKNTFNIDGYLYQQEVLCSFPSQLILIRYTCEKRNSVSLNLSCDSLLLNNVLVEKNTLIMRGKSPSCAEPNYFECENPIRYDEDSIHFEMRARVIATGGLLIEHGKEIQVTNAESVLILLAMGTSYSGFEKALNAGKETQVCINAIKNSIKKSWDELVEEHIEDYSNLFGRVDFNLGESSQDHTDKRLIEFANTKKEQAIYALAFQYGRYLLISSSREGSQAANLQGVWNPDVRPAWSSNYTTNINTQMNYWGSLVSNLKECEEPLIDFIAEVAKSGAKTAEVMYGCKGWVCHHNVDLWRTTVPMGGRYLDYTSSVLRSGMWTMGGVWLARHLWEHYLYTQDKIFLEEKAFPIMYGSMLFCLDWVSFNKEGAVISAPSISPENEFIVDGKEFAVTQITTMDISLITEILTTCLCAMNILGINDEINVRALDVLNKLPKYSVNKNGTLQEWDKEFEEYEVEHRHISHLYGLYPSNVLDESYFEACKKTLIRRGNNGTGWSLVWKSAAWSRLKDGNSALLLLENLLKPVTDTKINYHMGGVYPNLFFAHPPFQVDANLGIIAAIAEMLLQSHREQIELLPALPSKWENGNVCGLKTRGNIEVDIFWKNNMLEKAVLKSSVNKSVKVKYLDYVGEVLLNKESSLVLTPDFFENI